MTAFLVHSGEPGRYDVGCDERDCPDTVAADLDRESAHRAVADHDRDDCTGEVAS